MNKRQFKELTCHVSSERRMLDLESEVPGSILTGGNIQWGILFVALTLRKPCCNMAEARNIPVSNSLASQQDKSGPYYTI